MIISNSLQWFISIEILAIISFILTFKFFNKLNDKGYCISKITGIGLASFICWVIMLFSNGQFIFTPTISYIGIGLLALISIIFSIKLLNTDERKDLFHFIDKKYKFIIFIEIVFLGVLIGGTYIRGFSPDILGVHKLQEYIYIKSILLSDTLPPQNLWLSGYKLNTFYFGYFIFANLINISSINIDLAFNLIPGTILGFIAIASGGIIYNITNNKIFGILAGFITGFMSNYEALFQILEKGVKNGFNWWASGHMFTNGIFAEFPYWSFLLGDIPTYFISTIFILAFIYFILSAINNSYTINFKNLLCTENIHILLTSILLSIIGLTNIYSLFVALFLMLLIYSYLLKKQPQKNICLKSYVLTIFSIILTTLIILTPFLLNYKPVSTSIIYSNILNNEHTKAFLGTFGWFFIPCMIYLIIKLKEFFKLNKIELLYTLAILGSVFQLYLLQNWGLIKSFISIIITLLLLISAIYFTYRLFQKQINDNKHTYKSITTILIPLIIIIILFIYPTLTLISIFIIFSIFMLIKENNKAQFITYSLLLSGLLFTCTALLTTTNTNEIAPNIINSILISNSLLILALTISPIIYFTINKIPSNKKELYTIGITILLLPCLLFTILGTLEKTHNFKSIPGLIPMLSGSNHLIHFHENEFASIDWLRSNAEKNSVLLEACIPNEVYSGRISGYSGLTNIINWPNKQKVAYNKTMEKEISKRINDVNTIYTEPDKSKIIDLLKHYNVKYIYIGELENKAYPPESLKGFKNIGKVVYKTTKGTEKDSIIYEIN